MQKKPDYLNPNIPPGIRCIQIPVIKATNDSLQGFGCLIDDPNFEIEITRWPATGWRPVDIDSGDEGGTTEGTFISQWKGDVLYGRNAAVGGHYILGYGKSPEEATEEHSQDPQKLLLWHANYHPDGGQLFFPESNGPFLAPLAKPGDNVQPEDFVCFYFEGRQGLYIHPDVWHEGIFAICGEQRFFDKQGAVHARVSVDFPKEFDCLLEVDLTDLTD